MRVYLDAAPIIYIVEAVQPFAWKAQNFLSGREIAPVCSELSRLECRVKPLQTGDSNLLNDYDDYFELSVDEIVALSRVVVDRATTLRAKYGFKTPDALHLAAALEGGCEVFLTNDHRLDQCREIQVEVLS